MVAMIFLVVPFIAADVRHGSDWNESVFGRSWTHIPLGMHTLTGEPCIHTQTDTHLILLCLHQKSGAGCVGTYPLAALTSAEFLPDGISYAWGVLSRKYFVHKRDTSTSTWPNSHVAATHDSSDQPYSVLQGHILSFHIFRASDSACTTCCLLFFMTSSCVSVYVFIYIWQCITEHLQAPLSCMVYLLPFLQQITSL